MEIKKVAVLGCGLMGAGIAQTAAMAGYETTVREVSDDLIAKGFAGIEKSLAKFAEKGTIKEQPQEVRARLRGTTKLEDFAGLKLRVIPNPVYLESFGAIPTSTRRAWPPTWGRRRRRPTACPRPATSRWRRRRRQPATWPPRSWGAGRWRRSCPGCSTCASSTEGIRVCCW